MQGIRSSCVGPRFIFGHHIDATVDSNHMCLTQSIQIALFHGNTSRRWFGVRPRVKLGHSTQKHWHGNFPRSPRAHEMDAEAGQEDYGARFFVFAPEEQPAPELDSWNPDMWEPFDPKLDERGNFDPQVIRHVRWFERTKEFLQDRYGLAIGPDLFDCKAMKYQGRFSVEIVPEKERLWYIRALALVPFSSTENWVSDSAVGFFHAKGRGAC